ncbi:alpha-L-fucosidase [Pontiella sulfatireligans]|uniref:alpha-L-fucosidase n=1 Tax=Pontiella sulfatireligans TaxID=2750658 RepID=A0A6C2UIA8_9BACT|nr:alpha-L-fucosidase [Pontiella sulfatireligans]VGO19064.1 hypothetical protein SCARR_01120 [Pontiella sulfatireligans]
MKRKCILIIVLLTMLGLKASATESPAPTFETIYENREIPSWFNEDKFGIFVVWGLYSIPSFYLDGYAEWYWYKLGLKPELKDFHDRVYGADFQYEQFAPQFKAELWDPDFWCKLFKDSGAKYVVTTANYHDGFAMYPTAYSKTQNAGAWNSMEVGPKRDIIGEMNVAGEKQGLKMGIYYSLYEWYHPEWMSDPAGFATNWFHPKFKEVVSRYKPWHIFLDGDWEKGKDVWQTEDLAQWLYSESSVKDTVVVNDRWAGEDSREHFGDVFESEYGQTKYMSPEHPWQEDRGMGKSYGYNRTETVYDYASRDELLGTFSSVVGGGGNFLLCVGPRADGIIPSLMQERLLQIGDWLKINGEAIYGTTANPFWPRTYEWGTMSKKEGKLYLHIHDDDVSQLTLRDFGGKIKKAELLHKKGRIPVEFEKKGEQLSLSWPNYLNDTAVTIIALDVQGKMARETIPLQYENGQLEFNCLAMQIHGEKAYIRNRRYKKELGIQDWHDSTEFVSGEYRITQPGKYKISIIYACGIRTDLLKDSHIIGEGSEFVVSTAGQTFAGTVESTDGFKKYTPFELGEVVFDKAGKYHIEVKSKENGMWKNFGFQGIKLDPVK